MQQMCLSSCLWRRLWCSVVSYNESGTYHSKGCFKIKGTVEKEVIKYVENIMRTNTNCQEKCKCSNECNEKS